MFVHTSDVTETEKLTKKKTKKKTVALKKREQLHTTAKTNN